MTLRESWLLPEGIDELMPVEAAQLEKLHRQLVDRMLAWGYQLVVPPLVEYLDSLLTGTAKTLDIQTFKLTDQRSGRLLGVRADMTPQVARIAAHRLRGQSDILRLCYIGSVLHTLPQGHDNTRNPIQLGAEIYGHSGTESDIESMQLMIDLLQAGGVDELSLDIGHVGIYRGLAAAAGLTEIQEQTLFSALQRKAVPEIESLLADYQLPQNLQQMLLALAELNGNVAVLAQARELLADAPPSVQQALDKLDEIASQAQQRLPAININFDLAELRGYHYHTGVIFAAYQPDSAQAIAFGGRYDDIGEDFGHAQPATGFSLDLKKLVTQYPQPMTEAEPIGVAWCDDPEQQQAIERLRAEGHIVAYMLPGSQQNYRQTLINQNGHWQVTTTGN